MMPHGATPAAQAAGEWTAAAVAARLRKAATAELPAVNEPLSWLSLLEPNDAALVRVRSEGARWKLVCWRFGISRATAYRRWRYALGLIAWRLNGRPPPVGQSRRRFLARVRAGPGV